MFEISRRSPFDRSMRDLMTFVAGEPLFTMPAFEASEEGTLALDIAEGSPLIGGDVKIEAAKEYNVLAGYGQDASAVQSSGSGVPAVNLAVPTRYLHSHTGVIDRGDVEQAVQLVVAVVRALDEDAVEALAID